MTARLQVDVIVQNTGGVDHTELWSRGLGHTHQDNGVAQQQQMTHRQNCVRMNSRKKKNCVRAYRRIIQELMRGENN